MKRRELNAREEVEDATSRSSIKFDGVSARLFVLEGSGFVELVVDACGGELLPAT